MDTWSTDPSGRHELRYFDGTSWTKYVADAGVQSEDEHWEAPEIPRDPMGALATRSGTDAQPGSEPLDGIVAPVVDVTTIQVRPRPVLGMQPTSDVVVWVGQRWDLMRSASSGAFVSGHYRLTEDGLYVRSGLMSSREAVVPLYAILEVDIRQSVTQKPRGVGDCFITLDNTLYSGRQHVVLESVQQPQRVRDLIAIFANVRRTEMLAYRHQIDVESRQAGATSIQQAFNVGADQPRNDAPLSADVVLEQLRQLGELKSSGVLTEEEFQRQKLRLLDGR